MAESRTTLCSLFKTPLWLLDYPEAAKINPILQRAVEREMAHGQANPVWRRSNRGGWKGAELDLMAEPWAPLTRFLITAINALLVEGVSWRLQTNGVNVHHGGGYNVSHVHSHCLLSGVYYITVPPGAGELVLEDPRAQAAFANTYGLFREEQGGAKHVVQPREGLLVLFPSWLSHRVEPNGSKELRISLPINVMVKEVSVAAAPPAPPAWSTNVSLSTRFAAEGASRGFGAR